MTPEANSLSTSVDRDPAWPFLDKLDAGQIMKVCAKAAELQRVKHKSLPTAITLALIHTRLRNLYANPILNGCPDSSLRRSAGDSYRLLLICIPLTESAKIHGVPRFSENDSNYLDLTDISLADKADMFLAFQRRINSILADPTVITMLEKDVMSIVAKSTEDPQQGAAIQALLANGLVKNVEDLQKPENRCLLTPETLGCLEAYCDYRNVYPVASCQ